MFKASRPWARQVLNFSSNKPLGSTLSLRASLRNTWKTQNTGNTQNNVSSLLEELGAHVRGRTIAACDTFGREKTFGIESERKRLATYQLISNLYGHPSLCSAVISEIAQAIAKSHVVDIVESRRNECTQWAKLGPPYGLCFCACKQGP